MVAIMIHDNLYNSATTTAAVSECNLTSSVNEEKGVFAKLNLRKPC